MSDFLAFFIQRKSTDTYRKERALTKWSTRAHSRPASLLTFLNEGSSSRFSRRDGALALDRDLYRYRLTHL